MTLKGIGILEFSDWIKGRFLSLEKKPRNSSVPLFTIFLTSYLGGPDFSVFFLGFLNFFLGGNRKSSTTSPWRAVEDSPRASEIVSSLSDRTTLALPVLEK
jgi:hypothetical protein